MGLGLRTDYCSVGGMGGVVGAVYPPTDILYLH